MKRTSYLLIFLLAAGLGFWAAGGSKRSAVLLALSGAAENEISQEGVVLRPDAHDGSDPAWKKRYYYGTRSWGIRGSGEPEAGSIWFNSFPGASGSYQVTLGAILEADGSALFRVHAGDTEVFNGRLPYFEGKLDCKKRGDAGTISLGTHRIEHGQRIEIWSQSTYECGEKGAYGLWYELRFTPAPTLNAPKQKESDASS